MSLLGDLLGGAAKSATSRLEREAREAIGGLAARLDTVLAAVGRVRQEMATQCHGCVSATREEGAVIRRRLDAINDRLGRIEALLLADDEANSGRVA